MTNSLLPLAVIQQKLHLAHYTDFLGQLTIPVSSLLRAFVIFSTHYSEQAF
jgi:hypothetical protein